MTTTEQQQLLPQILDASAKAFSEWIVRVQMESQPGLVSRLSPQSINALRDDTRLRLAVMAEATSVNSPELFAKHMSWHAAMHLAAGCPREDLLHNLHAISRVLSEELPPGPAEAAVAMTRDAIAATEATQAARVDNPLEGADENARRYLLLLIEGRRDEAIELLVGIMSRTGSAPAICKSIIIPVMHEIGRLWHAGDMGVADEHFCTAATVVALGRINAMQVRSPANGRRIIVSSVGGDLHELSLRIVASSFEFAGWDVRYLGANTPATSIIEAIEAHPVDAIAVGASTVFHLRNAADLISAVRAAGHQVPIVVGGTPFIQVPDLYKRIGADGSAADAESAVALADKLVTRRSETHGARPPHN